MQSSQTPAVDISCSIIVLWFMGCGCCIDYKFSRLKVSGASFALGPWYGAPQVNGKESCWWDKEITTGCAWSWRTRSWLSSPLFKPLIELSEWIMCNDYSAADLLSPLTNNHRVISMQDAKIPLNKLTCALFYWRSCISGYWYTVNGFRWRYTITLVI